MHVDRYYVKDKNGRLQNAPYVDNSYKWAGGGLLSTAGDLVRFGNAMLYSYQHSDGDHTLPGYLGRETMRQIWTGVERTRCSWDTHDSLYGMGWGVMSPVAKYGHAASRPFYVSHTGGSIGASSVLLIEPRTVERCSAQCSDQSSTLPSSDQRASLPDRDQCAPLQGVAVAIIMNIQGVNLNPVAEKIARIFQEL